MLRKRIDNQPTFGIIVEVGRRDKGQALVFGLQGWEVLNKVLKVQVTAYDDHGTMAASGYIVYNVGFMGCIVQFTQIFTAVKSGLEVRYTHRPVIPTDRTSTLLKDAEARTRDGLGYLFMHPSSRLVMVIGVTQPEFQGRCTEDADIVDVNNNNRNNIKGVFKPFPRAIGVQESNSTASPGYEFTYVEGFASSDNRDPNYVDCEVGDIVRSRDGLINYTVVGKTVLVAVVGLNDPQLGEFVEVCDASGDEFSIGVVQRIWEGPEDTTYPVELLKKNGRGQFFRPCTIAIAYNHHKLWFGPLTDKYYYRFRRVRPALALLE